MDEAETVSSGAGRASRVFREFDGALGKTEQRRLGRRAVGRDLRTECSILQKNVYI